MVNVHLVDDGEIKVLLNDRLCNVRCQLWMALNYRHRPRTPAFIGRLKLGCGTDGKGWNKVKTEGSCVVVVDQKNDIRLVVLHPLLAVLVALKNGLPIRLMGFAKVKGCTNGGNVGCENGGCNFGHDQLTFLFAEP